MRPRNPELTLARQSKRAGVPKAEFVRRRTAAIARVAQLENWPHSVSACELADLLEIADEVYGEDAQGLLSLEGR